MDGRKTIRRTDRRQPGLYLQVCAGLLPKQNVSELVNPLSELSDDELAALERHLTALRARPVELEVVAEPVASPEPSPVKTSIDD
jgi:hypothetical protein